MSARSKTLLAATVLALAVTLFRLVPIWAEKTPELAKTLAGCAPMLALALCAGMWLPVRTAAVLAFGTFLGTELALNAHYGFPLLSGHTWPTLAVYAAVFAFGYAGRGRRGMKRTLVRTAGGVALFYVVSNTGAFVLDPGYAKTLSGWLQAQTVGLPGPWPQAWVFGLRMMAANLLFAAAFVLAARPQLPRPGLAAAALQSLKRAAAEEEAEAATASL